MKVQTRQRELYAASEQHTPGGVHTANRYIPEKMVFTRAAGQYMWDADGTRYVDYHAAFGPFILGHAHPEVNRRVIDTIQQTDLFGVGTTDLEVALCAKLVQHVPAAEAVLLCNSGSEATFHAIRLARAVTGRRYILKFQGCYHGFHDSVLRNMLSAPEKIGTRDPGSTGILDEVIDATLVCTFNDLDDVERTMRAHKGNVAAVILEPIPHNIGCVMPKPGFLEGLRQLTRDHGTILIFDEVVTGFRHGLGGYQKVCGVTPDLVSLGKAVANGFPLAVLGGRKDLMAEFNTRPGGPVFFAGTYNGHAVGVAAALATIDVMEREPVHAHVFGLGDRMRRGLHDIHQRLGIPATVAGFGSIFLTYFMEGPVENYTDLMRNDVARFLDYRRRLMSRGVFKIPMNLKRAHISYAHTNADIDTTLQAAEDVLTEMGTRTMKK
ncbi:MAG: aspartate aminotransferase family protein [Armatimonadota bacterium]